MKFLRTFLLASLIVQPVFAQDADPLAVTLPNGKVVHFPSAEQKAKYEAARNRQAVTTLNTAPTEQPTPTPRAKLGSSLDAPTSSGTGRGNVSAPMFTAAYYQADPESWIGKSVTVSVGYLTPGSATELVNGQRLMTAHTYNYDNTVNGSQPYGGMITVFAKPEDAFRLINQCGTNIQYGNGYWSIKTTMLKGKFGKAEFRNPDTGGKEHYCVFLSKD